MVIQPALTVSSCQQVGALYAVGSDVKEGRRLEVNVLLRERNTGHDPVYPAHAVGHRAVECRHPVTAPEPEAHRTNLQDLKLILVSIKCKIVNSK